MDTVLLWTVVAVSAVIGLLMLWFALELLWALLVTTSWARFSWHVARRRGMHVFPGVLTLLLLLLAKWALFLGYRKGDVTFYEDHGRWNGIGDWVIYPPEEGPGARG
jgi:hypothetical protein